MNNVFDASGHVGSRWCSCPRSPIASTVTLILFSLQRLRASRVYIRGIDGPRTKTDVPRLHTQNPMCRLLHRSVDRSVDRIIRAASTVQAQDWRKKKLRVKYGDGRRSVLQLVPAALQSCARWCRHPAVLAPVQSGIQLHGRKISLPFF